MFANNLLFKYGVLPLVAQGSWILTSSVSLGLLRLVSEYAAHSGLAHVQIGLMRSIGWSVPERYLYPLFASSPSDFWRRWNVYVRTWLDAYVFFPSAARIRRAIGRRAAGPLAVVVTLIASGLLHDVFVLGASHVVTLKYTTLFAAGAAVIVSWGALQRRLGSALQDLEQGAQRALGVAARVAVIALLAGGWSRL
jgi:D-alanyl-lipoteichoic acid acyltransferase DltB (MBOAT superfamily)